MDSVIKYAAAAAGGLVVGGGVTYLITKNRLKKKYKALADEEIASVKARYTVVRQEFATPADAVAALRDQETEVIAKGKELVKTLGYDADKDNVQVQVVADADDDDFPDVQVNIFDRVQPTAEELQPQALHGPRDHDRPYVISYDDFMEDNDYSKITLTYYELDNVLTDEGDGLINDVINVIGEENLHRFGQGSDDKNALYVRNEQIEADYEVVRREDAYSQVVLGATEWDQETIKEPTRGVRRMRDGDD